MEKLPLSTDGCPAPTSSNGTATVTTSTPTVLTGDGTFDGTSDGAVAEVEYFYLYRISYAWYALIGFVVTTSVGYLVFKKTKKIFLK